MPRVIINSGTGPCVGATEEHAIENMRHFLADCKAKNLSFVRIPEQDYEKEYGDGRFAFLVWKNEHCHEIQMPGLLLERVRYMGSQTQNLHNFSRLYVDGSSWFWCYTLLDEESFKIGT